MEPEKLYVTGQWVTLKRIWMKMERGMAGIEVVPLNRIVRKSLNDIRRLERGRS